MASILLFGYGRERRPPTRNSVDSTPTDPVFGDELGHDPLWHSGNALSSGFYFPAAVIRPPGYFLFQKPDKSLIPAANCGRSAEAAADPSKRPRSAVTGLT